MNSIIRTARALNTMRGLLNPARNFTLATIRGNQQRQITRNLWHMSCSQTTNNDSNKILSPQKPGFACSCGCNGMHSKAEKELVEFLTEEILAERKAQKMKTLPTELEGFKASLKGAEVTLTKQADNETIKIRFNVNHTVDTDSEPEIHGNMDKPDVGELKSKPSFKIDLLRDDTTVSLLCSFLAPGEQEDGYNDIFGLDEISIYNGDWNENIYAVSGEVIDSYLYDLILNYLEEKGISNEFVEKLSEYSTSYEHSAYIGLLEGLSKYASGK